MPHWLPWLTYGGRLCRLGALRKIGKLEAYQTVFRCQQHIRTQCHHSLAACNARKSENGSQQRVCNLIRSGLPHLGSGVFLVFSMLARRFFAVFFPLAMLSQYIFGPALFLISLFIVLIILLQRGRGGGLTGALGGAGGASAFGVKAGDIFTRITAVAVLLWIVLCALTCYWYLPESLNIATTPSSTSGEKSSEMGGFGELPSSPQDLKDLIANPATPETSMPVTPDPADSATPAANPVPSDVPPAAVDIKDVPTTPPVEKPASPSVDPALIPPAIPVQTDPKP